MTSLRATVLRTVQTAAMNLPAAANASAKFKCRSGNCMYDVTLCDGTNHCSEGEDELNCENRTCLAGQFRCSSGKCILESQFCDVYKDCPNGDDEGPELCKNFVGPEGRFKCGNHGCRYNHRRCDEKKDCPNGEDELNCHTIACVAPQFWCAASGACKVLRDYLRCDGRSDCKDGSDEIGCSTKPLKATQIFEKFLDKWNNRFYFRKVAVVRHFAVSVSESFRLWIKANQRTQNAWHIK